MALPGGIGSYRFRLQIQRATETVTAGGFGQPTVTWAAVATRWFRFETQKPNDAAENLQGQQVVGGQVQLLRLRPYAGLTIKDRLLYGSQVYQIEAIFDEGDSYLLKVRERVP